MKFTITIENLSLVIDHEVETLPTPTGESTLPSTTRSAEMELASRLAETTAILAQRDKRISNLLETLHAQDECIAEMEQKLAAAADSPAPALSTKPVSLSDLPVQTDPVFDEENNRYVAPSITRTLPATKPTTNGTRKPTAKSTIATRRLGYDEFDKLVRAEMKRLAPTPGTMPGYKIWDEMRNPALPTMLAVIRRYNCQNSAQLAIKLGMEPPLGKAQIVPTDEPGEDGDE